MLTWIDLEGLCNDARAFWSAGPWLVSELTTDHKDNYVVPLHLESDPSVVAFITPELCQGALAMNQSAIEQISMHCKRIERLNNEEKSDG